MSKLQVKLVLFIALATIINHSASAQLPTFTNVAAATNTDFGFAKDGGATWADLNNDGCLDLIINTNDNNAATRTRMYFSDCTLPNPTFTDVTITNALGFTLQKTERSVVCADLNNDGNIDVVRNTHNRLEVYLNAGPPNYTFGLVGMNPDLTLVAVPGGMNVEGVGFIDYNEDGWLDLVLENHNFGIDIYENPANGTAAFFHVTPNATPRGLPIAATDGDYMTLGDFNGDGLVDILARKRDQFDLWQNNGFAAGAGQFTANAFNQQAANGNKGGVIFGDFDNDGDLDFFWTDNGTNQIWEQVGNKTGVFAATGEPTASSGVAPNNIDGCSVGDIDLDGDLDLFLTSDAGTSLLYLNNGGMTFTQNNLGINVAANGEGCNMVDYDNDGDLDIYVNINGGANQLWENDLDTNNFLKVRILRCLDGLIFRDEIGAQVVLKDTDNVIISPVLDLGTSKGHGSQNPHTMPLALPYDPCLPINVEVTWTNVGGSVETLDTTIVPCTLPNNTLTLSSSIGILGGSCNSILPVEFVSFTGQHQDGANHLAWITANEMNNNYFRIERSTDGIDFQSIGIVDAKEYPKAKNEYAFVDPDPYPHINYYRLKQVDLNGASKYSEVLAISTYETGDFRVYPTILSSGSFLSIDMRQPESTTASITVTNMMGQVLATERRKVSAGTNSMRMQLPSLNAGIYLVTVQAGSTSLTQKIMIKE